MIRWTTWRSALVVAVMASAMTALLRGFPATVIDRGFALTVWETDEGLPNNDVYSVVQDSRGFLWLGTAGGPSRFDGVSFIRPSDHGTVAFQAATAFAVAEERPGRMVFIHELDASNLLMAWEQGRVSEHPANACLAGGRRARNLFAGRNGVLWILDQGFTWHRWTAAGIESFPPPASGSASQPPSMVELDDGSVLLSRGSGVDIYQNGELKRIQSLGGSAASLARSADGSVWIGVYGRIHRWRDGRLEWDVVRIPVEMAEVPQHLVETRDGALWVYLRNTGLHRIKDGLFERVPVSHGVIRSLLEDREGNLWVGTAGGGLNRIRRSPFELCARETSDTIGSVCLDVHGTVWIGNTRGIWRLMNGRAELAGKKPDWPSFGHAVLGDRHGRLWIGGVDGVFRFNPVADARPELLPAPVVKHVFALFEAADGSIWAGCENGPLLRYRNDGPPECYGPESGFDGAFAQVFGEDLAGMLWVGTRRGELFRFDDGRFQRVSTPLESGGTGILTITPDAQGSLWFGTRGLGFLRMKNGEFRFVGTSHGLPDGVISQTLDDGAGNFWVGSSSSIFSVAIGELDACADGRISGVRAVRFGRADGISGFYATGQRQPCAWRASDGRMWFVGRKGVIALNPAWSVGPLFDPEVVIDDVRADSVSGRFPGEFRSSNQRVEFRFTSPGFVDPDDVRFRYRLLPFETNWNDSEGQRLAIYPRLPPGSYTFEVAASHRLKQWSPSPARFVFTVRPAWWETWWFRIAVLAVITGAVVVAVRYWSHRRLRRKMAALEEERRVERERSRIARDLHDGIGSGLTQLGWLAGELTDDAAQAPELLDKSESLRSGIRELARDLDAAVWAVSPRHDTLASMVAYLCEFASEHFRRTPMRCRVAAPEGLPDRAFPPHLRNQLFMAAREALNNALKHSMASEVRMTINWDGRHFTIEVADNGCGFDPESVRTRGRHGLRNMEERLHEIGGTLTIDSGPTGTRVLMSAPLTSDT
jgi:signal transduction histidine kinase/ligand-binding sensor domain-containing protein